MQRLLRHASGWLYQRGYLVAKWRARRMEAFLRFVDPPRHARIIDLGGSAYNWNLIDHEFQVTIVNLPGSSVPKGDGRFHFVEADACDLKRHFEDQSFDVVFSNSVIEHVGDGERQEQFARETIRLAPAHWIQTPSDRFPVEVHTGVPFYWKLPEWVLRRLHQRWEQQLPAWYETIRATRALSRQRLQELFPESELYVEKALGFEKSYAAFSLRRS